MICQDSQGSLEQRCNGALKTLNGSLAQDFRDTQGALNNPPSSPGRTFYPGNIASLVRTMATVAGAAAVCENVSGWKGKLLWVDTEQGGLVPSAPGATP